MDKNCENRGMSCYLFVVSILSGHVSKVLHLPTTIALSPNLTMIQALSDTGAQRYRRTDIQALCDTGKGSSVSCSSFREPLIRHWGVKDSSVIEDLFVLLTPFVSHFKQQFFRKWGVDARTRENYEESN